MTRHSHAYHEALKVNPCAWAALPFGWSVAGRVGTLVGRTCSCGTVLLRLYDWHGGTTQDGAA